MADGDGATPARAPSAGASGDAAALGAALRARGLRVTVEPSGTLAVLVPAAGPAPDWPAVREEVVRAARAHGFTHVALDLGDGAGEPGSPPSVDAAR